MKKRHVCALAALLLALLLPAGALAGEGDPLLSVDDLLTLEESYETFLEELEELIVERGLLAESERDAWHDAQMGDFFQNGGYGSILASYMPGLLGYVRQEDTLLTLSVPVAGGTLELLTMRRYTPGDSSLAGLMLTLSFADEAGVPVNAEYRLSATSGLFSKWDALTSAYVSVGASAVSNGETVCWADQTPAAEAKNPRITIEICDVASGDTLGCASLLLTVDGDGFLLKNDALSAE